MRDAVVGGDRTLVLGQDVELAWDELPARLEEAALVRVLGAADARETDPGAGPGPSIWAWDHPLATLAQAEDDAR
jgi:hypothetical protein